MAICTRGEARKDQEAGTDHFGGDHTRLLID